MPLGGPVRLCEPRLDPKVYLPTTYALRGQERDIMKCKACDTLLSDYDVQRKDRSTGEFLDLCGECYTESQNAVLYATDLSTPEEFTQVVLDSE